MSNTPSVRRICILGSTGSIGTQALEVIEAHPEHLSLDTIVANNSWRLLAEQARRFQPDKVVIANEAHYQELKNALDDLPLKVYAGAEAVLQVVQSTETDVVLTALVGAAGLRPTIKAIESGKIIALANKETLVVAGSLVTQMARDFGVNIYPVDSEHSAIFQCLAGEWQNPIEKIILTASGGPFRGKTRDEIAAVSLEQALKHPNWSMGAKITIDSATLMNKGLEVIEAKWLFNLKPEQVEVVVHPQSILHSFVQFTDGSIKAQMGLPDMKLPILYALAYPNRLETNFPRFDFSSFPQLTFQQPDIETFGCLRLAIQAMKQGGNAPCILNAANEIAVEAFLEKRIRFLGIERIVEECLQRIPYSTPQYLEDFIEADAQTRNFARTLIV